MISFIGIPLYFLRFFLDSNIFINIHELKDKIDCIFDLCEKEWCQRINEASSKLLFGIL